MRVTSPSSVTHLPFFALLLLISFASVNAVLFTPALPSIAKFFQIPEDTAQYTISWFLVGYAGGQLMYGPLANRFGRKPTLYAGIIIQMISSIICAASGFIHSFPLLVVGRFFLALGSGVGLKMTYTFVNEVYEPKVASQKISLLSLAFAISPGIGVALGGILTNYFNWMSCFYACTLYGILILFLSTKLPETAETLDYDALRLSHLWHGYSNQFKNIKLVRGGLLMGCCTCFPYIFAACAPFVAINAFGMSSAEYGLANILPPIGLVAGSFTGAHFAKKYPLPAMIRRGISISTIGSLLMLAGIVFTHSVLYSIFFPMMVIYFGLCFIIANSSSIAMSFTEDKAHGSAVMNFINMGFATIVVLSLGIFPINAILLALSFLLLNAAMMGIFHWVE